MGWGHVVEHARDKVMGASLVEEQGAEAGQEATRTAGITLNRSLGSDVPKVEANSTAVPEPTVACRPTWGGGNGGRTMAGCEYCKLLGLDNANHPTTACFVNPKSSMYREGIA